MKHVENGSLIWKHEGKNARTKRGKGSYAKNSTNTGGRETWKEGEQVDCQETNTDGQNAKVVPRIQLGVTSDRGAASITSIVIARIDVKSLWLEQTACCMLLLPTRSGSRLH